MDTVAIKNVAAAVGALTVNGALATGVNNINITQAVATAATNVTNASAATVFGMSASVANTLTVGFTPGANNRTLQTSLNGAGTATTNATINYGGAGTAATDINAINIATLGSNNVTFGGSTSVRTVTITGSGNNDITLGAVSATAAVAITAANATGNNTIDIGALRLFTGSTITGSTGASTTTLGLTITGGAPVAPTFTNIEGLVLNLGSNGTLISAAVNTSITTLQVADFTAAANANAYNLLNFSGINSVGFGITGGVANQGGALTLTGTGAMAYTFSNLTTTALAAANNLSLGLQTLNGYSSLTINTAGGVGSTSTFTLGAIGGALAGINSTSLSTVAITHASTGAINLGTLTSTNANVRGNLTLVDMSTVAGQSTVVIGANSLAAASVINGSVGVSNITLDATNTGAAAISVNLLNGNNVYSGGAAGAALSQIVTAGTGNNIITTGAGTDVITTGVGSNTVRAGAGTNSVTFGSNATTGAVDTYIVSAAVVAGNQTSLTNWTQASNDLISMDVSDIGAGLMRIAGGAGATTAVVGATAMAIATYAGAAVTVAAGTTMVSFTQVGGITTAALLTLVSTNATAITLGNAAVTAGDLFLIQYLGTDGLQRVGGIVLAGAATTTGATAIVDIVLTGQATALVAGDINFVL